MQKLSEWNLLSDGGTAYLFNKDTDLMLTPVRSRGARIVRPSGN